MVFLWYIPLYGELSSGFFAVRADPPETWPRLIGGAQALFRHWETALEAKKNGKIIKNDGRIMKNIGKPWSVK